jgi:hypothetical protein
MTMSAPAPGRWAERGCKSHPTEGPSQVSQVGKHDTDCEAFRDVHGRSRLPSLPRGRAAATTPGASCARALGKSGRPPTVNGWESLLGGGTVAKSVRLDGNRRTICGPSSASRTWRGEDRLVIPPGRVNAKARSWSLRSFVAPNRPKRPYGVVRVKCHARILFEPSRLYWRLWGAPALT